MKSLDRIPTSKIERAGKLVQTGVKLGGNYMKFYSKKLLNPDIERDGLDEENARDIYDGLKESDITLALDQQQHRMQSMMFVNVVWTDDNGKPVIDPYTGEVVTDNDC